MKRLLILTLFSLATFAFAQQQVSVSGIIKTDEALPDNTRVGIHVVDRDGVTLKEVASALVVGGTFSVVAEGALTERLQPFRSGTIALPGLQTEYSVTPEGVNFARALTKVYVDANASGGFDGLEHDIGFLGIASVENPVGFFILLYVDRDATLVGRGSELQLREGWNIFTARFPESEDPRFEIATRIDDAVLDVFIP